MRFDTLQQGTLIRRYKRFLADVTLPNGDLVVAHCPNTGAMTGCAEPGSTVFLSPANNPKRKLAWTLEMIKTPQGLVCVHSALANKVVAEALEKGLPSDLQGFARLKPEVKYGASSRADFILDFRREAVGPLIAVQPIPELALVEVKAVTLQQASGLGAFPDAVSVRATRHMEELRGWVLQGGRAAVIFCVLHTGINRVAPAETIDPNYAQALRSAFADGVEVYALGVDLSVDAMVAARELPVVGLAEGDSS